MKMFCSKPVERKKRRVQNLFMPYSRPKRKAAEQAAENIKAIQDWENLPKNSSILREYARKLDQELSNEVVTGQVSAADLDENESNDVQKIDTIANATEKNLKASNSDDEASDENDDLSVIESESDVESSSEYESSFLASSDEDDWSAEDRDWVPVKKFKSESDDEAENVAESVTEENKCDCVDDSATSDLEMRHHKITINNI